LHFLSLSFQQLSSENPSETDGGKFTALGVDFVSDSVACAALPQFYFVSFFMGF